MKKLLTIVISVVMIMTMLASCKGSNSEEETTLADIPAYRICFTQKQDDGDLETEQILCIKDNKLFIITYSALSDYFEQMKTDVDTMLKSFKIK